MRRVLYFALMAAFVVALAASPALAKKAPIERTVVDGVALAEIKPSSQITPFYPATARTSKPHAMVILAAEIDAKGKVGNVDVVSTSVEGMGFESSAKDAVRQWRFHPALENDVAIDSVTVVRLSFVPPTLRRPEGFVFTERSPRFFAVQNFEEVLKDRTWTKAFETTTSIWVPGDYFFPADLPPCKATRGGSDCIYNKQDLRQFGGSGGPVIGLPPNQARGSDGR